MKIALLCNENNLHQEEIQRIDKNIFIFKISNRELSFEKILFSAFSTPARYVMEIYHRLRIHSVSNEIRYFFIFNPLFNLDFNIVEALTAILKTISLSSTNKINVFEDKNGIPIGYLLPKNFTETEIHFLTLLSGINGKNDADCLRNTFLIQTDERKIDHISLDNKRQNLEYLNLHSSVEHIFCWITHSALKVVRKSYGRLFSNSYLNELDQGHREKFKNIRDKIPFTAIMPHHAGEILFFALAAEDTHSHIKQVAVNERHEDIINVTAPHLKTLATPLPTPENNQYKTEEEYFKDVVACFDRSDPEKSFYNLLIPLRDNRVNGFHLVDHFSFALGSNYLNQNTTDNQRKVEAQNLKKTVDKKINILLHFEGEFPLKTYPKLFQEELMDMLYDAGYHLTVLTSDEPQTYKYSTVKYKNLNWYQKFLANQHLIIGIDSFPLQYAAHVNKIPSICMFGPSKPEATKAKSNPFYQFTEKNMPCHHCNSFTRCYANGKPFCFNYTEPKEIFDKAITMLNDVYKDSHQVIVSRISKERTESVSPVKILAIYFPQFHRLPENDMWWGNGFTEWVNVTKAKPQFKGHYQPRLPSELGFCDIMVPEMREEQTRLARRFGINGFCYYHYWFNGRRILEKAVDKVIESGEPNFPFCFCWANENWTKRWDGSTFDVQLMQNYSHEDDLEHIRHLIPIFKDPRYIKIDGKPIFFVYRIELLPNPAKTAVIWREETKKAGFPDIYLGIFENFKSGIDPSELGFDAAVEFGPDIRCLGEPMFWDSKYDHAFQNGELEIGYRQNRVFPYNRVVKNTLAKPDPPYKRFRGAFPSWDNSSRRPTIKGSTIIHGSIPEQFEVFLEKIINDTYRLHKGEERIIFINAWNEWAEGCYLEPDRRFGLGYLEAIKNAVLNTNYIPEFEMKKGKNNEKQFLETQEIKRQKLNEKIQGVLNRDPVPFDDSYRDLYIAQLFVDTGKGFSEESSESIMIKADKEQLQFDLHKYEKIKQFRFDPIANHRVMVRIDEVKLYDKNGREFDLSVLNSNAFCKKDDNIYIFKTIDSQIIFQQLGIPDPLKIVIKLEYISIGSEVELYIKLNEERKQIEEEAISQIQNTWDYKIGRKIICPIRRITKFINRRKH